MGNPNYYKVLEEGKDNDDNNNYYSSDVIKDLACVEAGIGGRFKHASKLKGLNYKQAIALKKNLEANKIEKEYNWIIEYKVWKLVCIDNAPEEIVPLTST